MPRFYQRAKLPLVAFVDADSGGRSLKTALLGWGIREAQIVDLRSLFDGRQGDFEIEDILSRDFYHAAVMAAYPEKPVDQPPTGHNGKRTKYYETRFSDAHRIGFNKRRVAEAVKRLSQQGEADDETRNNLRSVTDAIWTALQGQVGHEVTV